MEDSKSMNNTLKAINFLIKQKGFYVPEQIKPLAGCTCTCETLARKLRTESKNRNSKIRKLYYRNKAKEDIAIYGPKI